MGTREVARRAVEAQLAATAMELFTRRGFEATTVAQIADAAGISQRTFFRYFPTKEDAVVGNLVAIGQSLHDELVARPAGEAPWTALRSALHAAVAVHFAEPDNALRVARMLLATPALRVAQIDKRRAWQALLEPEVARRLGGEDTELAAAALVAAALAALDVAGERWVRTDGAQPFADLLDRALDAVRPAARRR